MDENQDVFCTEIRKEFDYPTYRLVMPTMYSAAALVTTVLNFLILISIWKKPSLHKPSYILIGSLALSDLLVGAIGDPLMAIIHIAALRSWSLKLFCQVSRCARGVVYALGGVSLITLTFISLDRLLAVKLRNRYQSIVTQKRVLCILLTCWIISCVVSATLFGYLRLNSLNLTGLMLFAGIGVLFLVVTITVCYLMAFYSLRKITSSSVSPSVQNDEIGAGPSSNIDVAKYRKSLITMFVVFIFTILFYTPLVCVLIISFVLRSKDFSSLFSRKTSDILLICISVAEFLSLLNSAMNPLLYLWRIRDIREAVKTTVKTMFKIF